MKLSIASKELTLLMIRLANDAHKLSNLSICGNQSTGEHILEESSMGSVLSRVAFDNKYKGANDYKKTYRAGDRYFQIITPEFAIFWSDRRLIGVSIEYNNEEEDIKLKDEYRDKYQAYAARKWLSKPNEITYCNNQIHYTYKPTVDRILSLKRSLIALDKLLRTDNMKKIWQTEIQNEINRLETKE